MTLPLFLNCFILYTNNNFDRYCRNLLYVYLFSLASVGIDTHIYIDILYYITA